MLSVNTYVHVSIIIHNYNQVNRTCSMLPTLISDFNDIVSYSIDYIGLLEIYFISFM